MNRASLQSALIDLGWLSLTHRVLGGRPAESYALRQLLRRPGAIVTVEAFAAEYEDHESGGGSMRTSNGHRTGSRNAVVKRIERLRAALADLGIRDAIVTQRTSSNEPALGYSVSRADAARIERALLYACGLEIIDEVAA